MTQIRLLAGKSRFSTPEYAAGSGAIELGPVNPGDERLTFLDNFHDIFVSVGVLFVTIGLGIAAVEGIDYFGHEMGSMAWQLTVLSALVILAGITWVLSIPLVGHQRRILPGIILALSFISLVSIIIMWAYYLVLTELVGLSEQDFQSAFTMAANAEPTREFITAIMSELPQTVRALPIILALSSLVPSLIYYRAFRLPLAGALVGSGILGLASMSFLTFAPYDFVIYLPSVNLALSVGLLLGAFIYDARDPSRSTHFSEIAFWYHILAASSLLGAVLLVTQIGWTFEMTDITNPQLASGITYATTALIIVGGFTLFSILINRRAYIIFGLSTTGLSLWLILNVFALEPRIITMIIMLAMGGFILILGIGWKDLRSILMFPFPRSGPLAGIFPPARQ